MKKKDRAGRDLSRAPLSPSRGGDAVGLVPTPPHRLVARVLGRLRGCLRGRRGGRPPLRGTQEGLRHGRFVRLGRIIGRAARVIARGCPRGAARDRRAAAADAQSALSRPARIERTEGMGRSGHESGTMVLWQLQS